MIHRSQEYELKRTTGNVAGREGGERGLFAAVSSGWECVVIRVIRRLMCGVVALIALSAGLIAPAQAAGFEAVLERNNLELKVNQPGAFAWIRPQGARRIWLTEGNYRWTDEIRKPPGSLEMREREIYLLTGNYDWNCRISFVNGTSSTYRTYCQLYPVSTGGAEAYTPAFDFSVGNPSSIINWRSRLGRIPTS